MIVTLSDPSSPVSFIDRTQGWKKNKKDTRILTRILENLYKYNKVTLFILTCHYLFCIMLYYTFMKTFRFKFLHFKFFIIFKKKLKRVMSRLVVIIFTLKIYKSEIKVSGVSKNTDVDFQSVYIHTNNHILILS